MENIIFSTTDIEKIKEYFGKKPEELSYEEFETRLKELRVKYHPDKYEKYGDDTIRELTGEKFKEVELLSEKLRKFISTSNKKHPIKNEGFTDGARFAYNALKIEIISDDKDLKYLLFGTFYRWLERGDTYRIKGTNASIIMDDYHMGRSIGFTENIRIYLTFSQTDNIHDIILWLYNGIKNGAKYLIIGNQKVKPVFEEMLFALKKKTLIGQT